jgi:hypothetical protein
MSCKNTIKNSQRLLIIFPSFSKQGLFCLHYNVIFFIFCWLCFLLQILGNNQLDALFRVFIYFMYLHVSSVTAFIIRRPNYINTSSGMISLCKWLLGMPVLIGIPSSHLHRLIIPDDVLIQLYLLMISAVMLGTCRDTKYINTWQNASIWLLPIVCVCLKYGTGFPLIVRTLLNKYWFQEGVKLNILNLTRSLKHMTVVLTISADETCWRTDRHDLRSTLLTYRRTTRQRQIIKCYWDCGK